MKVPAGPIDKERYPEQPNEALEMMMKHYGTAVLRSAFFYTGDRHLAEDMSQEAFLRAYRSWGKFRGSSSVKTWLMKITINVCRDRLGLKMSGEEPTDPQTLTTSRVVHVEDEALRKLERSEILRYVMMLPLTHQEVLYLYYYLELSTREIADSLSVPEGTVRGRLHRAREQLGALLNREENKHERA